MPGSTERMTILTLAITIALVFMTPAILTTGAFAAPKIDKGSKTFNFRHLDPLI